MGTDTGERESLEEAALNRCVAQRRTRWQLYM